MSYADKFFEIINTVQRTGIADFLDWLVEETDFLTAPASAKYHGCETGGLLKHSIAVYYNLYNLAHDEYSNNTIAIVALFHDICKANFYEEFMRNVKDKETGIWSEVKSFRINEQFPYGSHGGKSVYLMLSHGLHLYDEEAIAINNHMGGWDVTPYHNPSGAFTKYHLPVYLHIADIMATYIDKQ